MGHRYWRACIGTMLVLAGAAQVIAGDSCCAICGCRDGNRKTCRLVCEQKKVTVTCWGCQDEDFCLPGPSDLAERHYDDVCAECGDPDSHCTRPRQFVWTEWIPSSRAKVHTKQKLMKRTVTRTVPSYKWVVEDLCEDCRAKSTQTTSP